MRRCKGVCGMDAMGLRSISPANPLNPFCHGSIGNPREGSRLDGAVCQVWASGRAPSCVSVPSVRRTYVLSPCVKVQRVTPDWRCDSRLVERVRHGPGWLRILKRLAVLPRS